MTEEDYLKQVIAGNTGYYRYLIDKYKDMLYSVAMGILKNNLLAEEAVQDAFVKAYQGLKNFRGDSKFSTWLYKIVVNESLKKVKGESRFGKELTADELLYDDMHTINNAVVSMQHEEQKHFINQVLDDMPQNESLLLRLFYLNERSVEEINDITGLSRSNIKVILFRARKTFYGILNNKLKTELRSIL
jgi:RNA polymerase sigma factor (sigma-70 family)